MATKFYVDTNICYFGDLLLPKKDIKVKFYESDTKVLIYDEDSINESVTYYDGLITGLTDSGGTPYANRAALVVVLQDFYG
jgi:hypothetical protein